jgi:L-alanine-DL-glutamate epimerase-like enolase superfamily enzyme
VYKELIDVDVEVEIDDGFVGLPQGTGLGVRLNPDLFKLKRPGYRISKF